MDDWTCIFCDKPIGMFDKVCKHCGEAQYDDDEEDPIEEMSVEEAKRILRKNGISIEDVCMPKRSPFELFSDEEKLALGLYPEDEGMKMSLISRILKSRR